MAMAGAFTSLGADLTSMAINPAGLGMYRHNENFDHASDEFRTGGKQRSGIQTPTVKTGFDRQLQLYGQMFTKDRDRS